MAGVALITLEAAYALLRPAPVLPEFDPSGDFGDRDNPRLRVVVLGDSTVTAPGVDHPDETWVRIVCHRLAERRHISLLSVAIGGSTARTVIQRQLQAAVEFGPDIALLAIGANDTIHAVPLRRFEAELDTIVSRLSSTGAMVIQSGVADLGTIPRLYPPLRTVMTRRSAAYHRAHHRVADRHGAMVVDQRSDDRRLWIRDRSLWSEDLFHVSASGHLRWADSTWRTLEPALPEIDG